MESFEGSQVFYRVQAAAEFHDRDLVIFGGGDSALDWTVALADKVRSLVLVHRRAEFRAAPATVAKMHELVAAGKMRFIEGTAQSLTTEGAVLSGVRVKDSTGTGHDLPADRLLAFFGLAPKLGPIAEWNLELEKRALKVDTEKFQTSVPAFLRSVTSIPIRERRN